MWVVGGCAHPAAYVCNWVGHGGETRAMAAQPRNRLYASACLERYVSGDTFATARLG